MTNTTDNSVSYSIDEWCMRRKVCRATFYNLKKAGKAPRLHKIGSRTIISAEADAAWVRAREEEYAREHGEPGADGEAGAPA